MGGVQATAHGWRTPWSSCSSCSWVAVMSSTHAPVMQAGPQRGRSCGRARCTAAQCKAACESQCPSNRRTPAAPAAAKRAHPQQGTADPPAAAPRPPLRARSHQPPARTAPPEPCTATCCGAAARCHTAQQGMGWQFGTPPEVAEQPNGKSTKRTDQPIANNLSAPLLSIRHKALPPES